MDTNEQSMQHGLRGANSVLGSDCLLDPTSEAYLVRIGRRAMACQFQIFLNAGEYADGCPAAIQALDLVEQLEAQMSVFRSDSEICSINRDAATGPVAVEPGLFDLLQRSIELWQQTGGAFDITAGPLSEVWGFARRSGRMPTIDELAEAQERVSSRWIKLDPSEQTIAFGRESVQINLGAIGKGEALDRAADVLTAEGIEDFLFHGGQSSVLARGTQAAETGGGWTVGLIHPLRPQIRLGQIRLRDAALSTSGSGTQCFTHRGRRYGHILDPRTGHPAEGMLSSTVIAPTAAEADALSTALYVMGPQAARNWCEAHSGISAILIWTANKTGGIHVETIRMDDGWESTTV